MFEIDLFCFPYAGGSARAIYSKWEDAIDRSIHIVPMELAGHGVRMMEPPYASISQAVTELFESIRPNIVKRPYALYGHSMGTVFAYEIALVAKEAELPPPVMMFLSGRLPNNILKNDTKICHLSDEDFISEILKIGGTSKEVFESTELRNIFIPILRNDYMLVDNYIVKEPIESIASDIVFFFSDEDKLVSKPEIFEWKKYITGDFNYYEFKGGHFFINDCYNAMCKCIEERLVKTEARCQK